VGDFNRDGKPDLAVTNASSGTVTVLLGDGSGGFSAAPGSPFPMGNYPNFVAVGDLNGDGIPDLAVTCQDGCTDVTVLLGTGTGGFTPASGSPFTVGANSFSVAVGDFNGDGKPDLAVAVYSVGGVTVLLGGMASTASSLSTTSPVNITSGQSVPLTLTVSDTTTAFNAPTGTATFLDGATVLGTAGQTGSPYTFSASSLSLGSHTLTATYGGDGRSFGSTSNSITIQVNASQTIAFGPLANQTFGSSPPLLSASASSGLSVSFASTTPGVCTVSGTAVTLVALGACTIQATQGGDANYSAATPVDQSFQVTSGTQTITFGTLSNEPLGTAPFPVSASASSGLAVSFASTTPAVCTTAGSTVTLASLGTCSIQATQAGNTDWTAATPVNQSFQVTKESQTITFGALSNQPFSPSFGTSPFTVNATASSGLPVSFSSTTPLVCTLSATTVTLLSFGTCSIQATQAGNDTWAPATPVIQSFHVIGSLCDVTQDANPSVADVQGIINEALGLTAAIDDLTKDGVVNAADIQIVINAVLGLGCKAS
jgi:hypothetical protein